TRRWQRGSIQTSTRRLPPWVVPAPRPWTPMPDASLPTTNFSPSTPNSTTTSVRAVATACVVCVPCVRPHSSPAPPPRRSVDFHRFAPAAVGRPPYRGGTRARTRVCPARRTAPVGSGHLDQRQHLGPS